jgi:hypothetical protein
MMDTDSGSKSRVEGEEGEGEEGNSDSDEGDRGSNEAAAPTELAR